MLRVSDISHRSLFVICQGGGTEDTLVLGSSLSRGAGSSPVPDTISGISDEIDKDPNWDG